MPFFVYILHSKELNKYYVGSTSLSVTDRLKYHLGNHSGFTAKAKDWVIIYQQEVHNVEEARSLERKIKKRGAHRYINDLTTL